MKSASVMSAQMNCLLAAACLMVCWLFSLSASVAADSSSWGRDPEYPVYLSVAVQSTLPSSFVIETLQPTLTYLRTTLPNARIGIKRMSPAELHEAVRLQNVHAFIADAGIFADLQSQGLAEQLAAYRSADATDPAYVSGMAVVVPKKSSVHDLEDLKNLHILSDAQDNFGSWMIFEGRLERTGLDAAAFLSRTTFNSYIAPPPLERLEAGEGDAAVVARCELEKLAQQGFPAEHFRVVGDLRKFDERCSRTGMLYPGTIFGIAAHVSGETAKAVSTAVLSMPASSFGEWSLVTDFGQVKDLYRTLKRGPYAHLRDNPMMAFWMKWRGWFGALMLTILGWGIYTLHVKHLVEKRTADLKRALAERDERASEALKAREALGALERAGVVSELSSMFAHEVRQPLSVLTGYAGGLRMYADRAYPEDRMMRETTGKIDAAAQRVSDIVERVRNYARGQSRRTEVVSIGMLMHAGLEHFSHSTLASGVEVVVTGEESLMVEVDSLEMGLVFLNLVRNAAQACTGAGIVRPRIELAAREEIVDGRPMVVVTVDDNGTGFDEDRLASLVRVRPQTSKSDGLGLGLMIVRTILEHHSGGLEFENQMQDGKVSGGRVIVRLPVAEEAEAQISGGGDASSRASG